MTVPRQPLKNILSSADPNAVDLLEKLLVLNPLKRLTAEQALQHPYVLAFHKPEREPALDRDVVPTLSDAIQLSVDEYRSKLYEVIAQQKRQQLRRMSLKYSREPLDTATTATTTTTTTNNANGSPIMQSGSDKISSKAKNVPVKGERGSAERDSTLEKMRCKRSTSTQDLTQQSTNEATRPAVGRKLVTRHSDNSGLWNSSSSNNISSNNISSNSSSSSQVRNKESLVNRVERKCSAEQSPPRRPAAALASGNSSGNLINVHSHSGQPLVTNNIVSHPAPESHSKQGTQTISTTTTSSTSYVPFFFFYSCSLLLSSARSVFPRSFPSAPSLAAFPFQVSTTFLTSSHQHQHQLHL